ncbi:MAG: sirohydrochlorin chelatase [Alphaproteobacteria bacterium]|nr:MAG: sirohydrochlorin chelatase [Alphaproteobacteria bacterium]
MDGPATPGTGPRTGIFVCGHGSRDVDATREFEAMVADIRRRFPDLPVEHGYLEFARPVIHDGLAKLVAAGCTDIRAVPGMLFAAGHVKNDLPSELNSFMAETKGATVRFGRDLAIDPKLLRAAADRIDAALSRCEEEVEREETCLVVIGRGTSDPDANSNIAKVARMLWEGMGFGHAEIGFSGVAHPRTDVALRRAARLGFRRIVVFPYFLFTGILVKRIREATQLVAAEHPGVDFVDADYLGIHPLVVDTMVERIHEIGRGETAMNCQLCKYREQVIGFEDAVGAIQEGHHHHVRGIGTDADHDHHHHHSHHHHHGHGHSHGHSHNHSHNHSHDHSHDHSHHEHPHAHAKG